MVNVGRSSNLFCSQSPFLLAQTVGSLIWSLDCYINSRSLLRLCFSLLRSDRSLSNSTQNHFFLHLSVHCCHCSIISTLGTFRIKFKMTQSLTASPFFHLFALVLFELTSQGSRANLQTCAILHLPRGRRDRNPGHVRWNRQADPRMLDAHQAVPT